MFSSLKQNNIVCHSLTLPGVLVQELKVEFYKKIKMLNNDRKTTPDKCVGRWAELYNIMSLFCCFLYINIAKSQNRKGGNIFVVFFTLFEKSTLALSYFLKNSILCFSPHSKHYYYYFCLRIISLNIFKGKSLFLTR